MLVKHWKRLRRRCLKTCLRQIEVSSVTNLLYSFTEGDKIMAKKRKLGRTSDHRKAMLRAMVTFLLENGKIETTVTRAKEVRSETEKMITLGKKGDLHAKRQVFSYVTKEAVSKKLFDEIAPGYNERSGGYTRIIRIGPRRGDAAEMALIELV
jgi:large subunit ribosomal protein L17